MIRVLIIVFAVGLVVSAASIATAIGLGPFGFGNGRDWTDFGFHGGHRWSGPQTTRDIPWAANHDLVFAYSGETHYTQGPEHKVTVTGPADLVEKLAMVDGRLRIDNEPLTGREHLDVVITAPDIDDFTIYGSSTLTIDNYDQDRLRIDIMGNGDVNAKGKARVVEVDIKGSGDVDVSGIASEETDVDIKGSGDTTIAPAQTARIDIAGSGDVTLLSNPPTLDTNIRGSGDIRHRAPPAETAPAKP